MDILLLSVVLFLQTPVPQAPNGEDTPVPPVTAPAQPQRPQSYIVGPQDVLSISVFDENSLSGRFVVDADGFINFPLVGRVQAEGATVRALEDELR